MSGDHRETIAEDNDDRALNSGEFFGQHNVIRYRHPVSCEVVIPVHPPQIARVCALRISITDEALVNGGRVSQLCERWQHDASFCETADRIFKRCLIDQSISKPKLVFQCVSDVGIYCGHSPSLTPITSRRHLAHK